MKVPKKGYARDTCKYAVQRIFTRIPNTPLQGYLEAGGIAQDREGMLFRSTGGRGRGLTERPLYRVDVYRMIKRRAMAADFGGELNCHTFRATGLTNYLMNGGTLETGAEIAGHASTRTR